MKKTLVVAIGGGLAACAVAAPMPQETAVARAMAWAEGNPVMKEAARELAQVTEVREGADGYPVWVVELEPSGYLVLNSDDRLPLVVSFSAESRVDLRDAQDNAFRAMLMRHVGRMGDELATPGGVVLAESSMEPTVLSVSELVGPLLETTWNQSNPYNLLCPDDPGGSEDYGYRVPTGCTPTAYAQILGYHRWPVFGQGSRLHSDASGSLTGDHFADFSDEYDWESMLPGYAVFSANPPAAEAAVSELMYELGVAAEADFEGSGTSSSIVTLGRRLAEHLFFESPEWRASQADLVGPMEADLRAGFPSVVSIPGHAIVADGLMVDDGVTTYHINYGWGGTNNGWWSKDGIPGGSLGDGVTSLKPRLMAFAESAGVLAVAGEPVELRWILPKRREAEADELTIFRFEEQAGLWVSDASEITAGNHSGWELAADGRSGDAWFAGPNGPAVMVLDEVFVPDAATEFGFWFKRRLGSNGFSVSVSADGGASYDELLSDDNHYSLTWEQRSVSLGAYAGQQVKLRFELSYGGYYSTGGVWLDDLSMSSGGWHAWAPFATASTLAAHRFSETTSEVDDCDDFTVFEVSSTSTYKDWVCGAYGEVATSFYKEPGGYGNREYHLTSMAPITPGANTRLVLRAKYKLGTDLFRVLASADGTSFSELWSGVGTVDWSDSVIDLAAYAGQAVFIRIEYTPGSYYSDGGVWIDSVQTQEVVNPEYEHQPVHYTVLGNPEVGSHTLAAMLSDAGGGTHGLSPSFTLTVSGPPGDLDNDGMPDAWEETNFVAGVAATPGGNPDGDNQNNLQEYIAGTDPEDSGSCFRVAHCAKPPTGGMSIEWTPVSGRIYRVLWSPDLETPFEVISNEIEHPVGSYIDTAHAAETSGFYQVDVRLK